MNYQNAVNNIFASGTVPNGYFGDRAHCQFSVVSGTVFVVHSFGCHVLREDRTGDPMRVADAAEALWRLRNHPRYGDITVTSANM